MPHEYDLFFGRVAVELGFVSPGAVETALAEIERNPRPQRLGIVLKEGGLLTREQFRAVTASVAARTEGPDERGEEAFGRLAIRRKFALAYQVRQALLERREQLRKRGATRSLKEILIERSILTPEQAEIVEEDRKGLLSCPACNAPVDVRGEAAGTEIACRRCDHLLRVGGRERGRGRIGGAKARPEGHRVGSYRIVREIGKGAMGVVYEARDLGTGKDVALKILSESIGADPSIIERFRREAAMVAGADHPAIVPILEVGEEDGAFFIAMEYVEGEPLDTLISASPISIPLAVRTAFQVAEGLEYAHGRGVIHRDIKPGNILLHRTGSARILDFGLAKQRDVATITASGTVVGTPMYMSPEQASPGATIDFRTDIYSLGATLYEILTGVPPFVGDNVQTLIQKVRTQEPPTLRSFRPEIPRSLENVVRKAMAKDPGKRYATAKEMAADLRRFLAGGDVTARPPGFLERIRAFLSRNREWIAVSLLSFALLAGGIFLWNLHSPRSRAGSGGSGADRSASEALVSDAFNAFRLGRYEEAVELYSELWKRNAADADALLFRALSFRALGEREKSLADLDQALALNPGLLRARFERARLFLEMGRPLDAASDLRAYMEARPKATEVLMLMGEALEAGGKPLDAMDAFCAVTEQDPDRGDAHLALARLEMIEDPARARDRLDSLTNRAPDLPGLHRLLGRALEACGSWDEALRSYREEVRRQGISPSLREDILRVTRRIEKAANGGKR